VPAVLAAAAARVDDVDDVDEVDDPVVLANAGDVDDDDGVDDPFIKTVPCISTYLRITERYLSLPFSHNILCPKRQITR